MAMLMVRCGNVSLATSISARAFKTGRRADGTSDMRVTEATPPAQF